VVGAEAAVEADGELFEVLGVCGVDGGYELFEGTLKAAQLFK